MTKYIDKTKTENPKKKTIFKKFITGSLENNDLRIVDAKNKPEDWKFVEFIRHDIYYEDVFFAWNNEDFKTIYFGEKGDEFE